MGTTSACAENTKRHFLLKRLKRNYLRVRGEYVGKHILSTPLMELPPRARRIPYAGHMLPGADGTTSACAENTAGITRTCGHSWNYLRMRGEYSSCVVGQDTTLELPPHARRIRGVNPARRIIRGTTSACAENTCRWHPSSLGCWNYLRMRGEYPSPLYMRPASLELPPHARRIQSLMQS